MKKLLSVVLSVMLILSTLSVLMILPAGAETVEPEGPTNLITNGDISMGTWADQGYTTPAMGEENWGMIVANNAYGWRSAGYVSSTTNASYGVPYGNAAMYWHNRGLIATSHPSDSASAPSMQVNKWNQSMQDIKIQAGKTYKVSADVTFIPASTASNYTAWFDIAIVNKAGQFIDQVDNKFTAVSGKDYDLCDSGDEVYNSLYINTATEGYPTFTSGETTYWDFGEFKTYSFTFEADDVISDYALSADGEGNYGVTLALQNSSGLVMLADNVSVYEVATITATEGGVVNAETAFVGETVTLTAKPYYGNGFAGWYQGETLVSDKATFTGVVSGDLTAKFTVFNQIIDGDFESGTTAGVDAFNAITNHYGHPGACYNATLTAPVGSTAAKHGNNVAKLNFTNPTSASNRQVLNIPVTIEKNKTYYFETAVYNIDTNADEPRYNVVFTPATTIAWNSGNIAQYVPNFTFNFYSEKNGVSSNVWSWQGSATVDSGKTVKNSAFELNSAANVGVYQPNEWSVIRFIFESGDSADLFGANDTVTVNLQLGAQGSSASAGRDLLFDNMFFGEASSANAAPSASEGGYIETAAGAQNTAEPMYIKSTASGAAFGSTDKDVSYYPVVASNDVVTAYPYYGNTFAGWYDSAADDATLLSTNPVYSGGKPGVVAKFNRYNQIDNGDFENGAADVYIKNAAYGSEILEEANGNKYFRMSTTTTGNDLYAYQFYFTLEKNKKYIISYDLRSGVDENGNLLSTSGSAFRRMLLESTGTNSFTWGKVTFADGYTMTSGNDHAAYKGTFDAFPAGGTDLNPAASSTSFPGVFNRSNSDWTNYSIVVDTSSIKVKDVEAASDSVDFGLLFGPNGGCTMALDIDNIVVSEVKNEVELAAGNGGCVGVDRVASTEALPVTLTAYPEAGYAFANWTDANGEIVSEEAVYTTFDKVSLTANFVSSIPKTNNDGGYVIDNGDGTYTAKPYYGNVFVGWYNLEGLKSSNATISYNDSADCIATFTQYNQIIDGDFEDGKGVEIWQSYESANGFFIDAADGIDGAGMMGYSTGNALMSVKYPVKVQKNGAYVMQFNMKLGDITANGENTPVWSLMISGTPEGNTWGYWPKLDSYKMTIQSLSNSTEQYVVSGYDTTAIHQASLTALKETFGDEWLQVTFEIAFDDDTATSGKTNLFANSDEATIYLALGHNQAINKSTVYYDNFSFYENTDLVVFENKENVRPVRVGIGPMSVGTTYSFALDKAADVAATVTVNGEEISAVNGIYSFVVENENAVAISLANDDEYPEAGKDFEGNSLTAYNHDLYTKNIWDGEIVYHETALIYKDRTEIQLMYPISDIVSVRSYDLQTYYVEGFDFEINEKGNLVILPGSKIPVAKFGMIADADSTGGWQSDDADVLISEYSDAVSANNSIVVTYTHDTEWEGAKQTSVANKLSVYDKLQNGEDVHIVFYGDSMSSGWSASGGKTDVYTTANDGTTQSSGLYFAPYAPNWMIMYIEGLKKQYPDANITWENLSLGGKASNWGLENFEARYNLLSNKDIDLFMIGWGINDNGAGHTVEEFKANDQGIIDAVRAKCPDTAILLYGANCTNTYSSIYDYETLMGYEAALHELANENTNIAATNLTSIFMDVAAKKEVCDLLGNNLNHANDFGCRIYAQTMISAMSPAPEAPDASGDFDTVGSDVSSIVTAGTGVSAEVNEYTEDDKLVNGYDAATMGNGYLKVTANPNTSYLDVGFPVELVKGNKYLAHFKLRVLSTIGEARFDVRIDTAAASWSGAPAGIVGKTYASFAYGDLRAGSGDVAAFFSNWETKGYAAQGYVDFYMVLDATAVEDQTAYINIGLRNGGEFAVDNFTFINQADLAPSMVGAMLNVDGSTVHYVTSVDLPAYVSMNCVTTHMIAKHFVDTLYPDRAYDFDHTMKEAGFASMRADETSRVLLNDNGEVMRSGNFYTTYEGFASMNSTARVLARTEIHISDNYGNSLGITVGTNNTDADKAIDKGVYSRSLTQMKRLAAKALIEGEYAALAAEMITPIDGKALWNCNIEEVWSFVLAVKGTPAE